MNDKIYCENCDDFVDYHIIEKVEERDVMGKELIEINSKVAICNICGTELFLEELEKNNQKRAFNIYRDKNYILYPEKIKEIRDKYGLTQKDMSKLLGWGDITYHRYENGSLPDQAHNNILLLINEPANLNTILENSNHSLEYEKEIKLKSKINSLKEQKEKERLKKAKKLIKAETIDNGIDNWRRRDDKIANFSGYKNVR